MKAYLKKPIQIQAFQWDGNGSTYYGNVPTDEQNNFIIRSASFDLVNKAEHIKDLRCRTHEGTLKVSVGDYVVRGIKGEYYPVSPDVFKATYEEVDNED